MGRVGARRAGPGPGGSCLRDRRTCAGSPRGRARACGRAGRRRRRRNRWRAAAVDRRRRRSGRRAEERSGGLRRERLRERERRGQRAPGRRRGDRRHEGREVEVIECRHRQRHGGHTGELPGGEGEDLGRGEGLGQRPEVGPGGRGERRRDEAVERQRGERGERGKRRGRRGAVGGGRGGPRGEQRVDPGLGRAQHRGSRVGDRLDRRSEDVRGGRQVREGQRRRRDRIGRRRGQERADGVGDRVEGVRRGASWAAAPRTAKRSTTPVAAAPSTATRGSIRRTLPTAAEPTRFAAKTERGPPDRSISGLVRFFPCRGRGRSAGGSSGFRGPRPSGRVGRRRGRHSPRRSVISTSTRFGRAAPSCRRHSRHGSRRPAAGSPPCSCPCTRSTARPGSS